MRNPPAAIKRSVRYNNKKTPDLICIRSPNAAAITDRQTQKNSSFLQRTTTNVPSIYARHTFNLATDWNQGCHRRDDINRFVDTKVKYENSSTDETESASTEKEERDGPRWNNSKKNERVKKERVRSNQPKRRNTPTPKKEQEEQEASRKKRRDVESWKSRGTRESPIP